MSFNFGNKNKCIILGIIVIIFLIIVGIISACLGNKKNGSYEPKAEMFVDNNEIKKNNYNALYTTPNEDEKMYIKYIQPPGDTKAQEYGRSGQGTNGGFLPLQGNGAQIMMANSAQDNTLTAPENRGTIGGHPNYTTKKFTSWMNGFNNFGYPFSDMNIPATNRDHYSNSYLIDGGNERVENSGQKGNLGCSDWWPNLEKNEAGFCTMGSDAMVNCDPSGQNKTIQNCIGEGGERFVKSKMMPRWQKV